MDAEIEAEYYLNQACFSKVKKWLIILENGLKRGYFATNLRPFFHFFKSANFNLPVKIYPNKEKRHES